MSTLTTARRAQQALSSGLDRFDRALDAANSALELHPAAAGLARLSWWAETASSLCIAAQQPHVVVLDEASPSRMGSLSDSIRSASNIARGAEWMSKLMGTEAGAPLDRSTDLDLIRELHQVAMAGLQPNHRLGAWREREIKIMDPRIGKVAALGTPAADLNAAMTAWSDAFDRDALPGVHPLIRSGLAHLEFERHHPFPDGNGRVGRIVMHAMHVESGLPELPLNAVIEHQRGEYLGRITDSHKLEDPKLFLDWHVRAATAAGEWIAKQAEPYATLVGAMAEAAVCNRVTGPQAEAAARAIAAFPITTDSTVARSAKIDERAAREIFYRLEGAGAIQHCRLVDRTWFVSFNALAEMATPAALPAREVGPKTQAAPGRPGGAGPAAQVRPASGEPGL